MASRDAGAAEPEGRRRRHGELLGELKTVNAEVTDLEWTLAELEQQIKDLAVATGDEAQERRLRDLRRWRGVLEERALRQMFRAEELSVAIAEVLGHSHS